MSPRENSQLEFYFDDPRLRMTVLGRLTVRIVTYVAYLVLTAAAFTFLFSDLAWLRWAGALLAVFLLDRLMYFKEADRSISEMPKEGRINIADYVSPEAFLVLERALDRSRITGSNFYLEAVRHLLGLKEASESLRRLDVAPEEFRQKADEFLKESVSAKSQSAGTSPEDQISLLANAAFEEAVKTGGRFVRPENLFSALASVKDESAWRLFNLFSLQASDLELASVWSSSKRAFRRLRRLPASLGGFVFGARKLRHRIMNRAWTSRPTPALDRFSVDFTDLVRQERVGFLVGHAAEYERLLDVVSRSVNPNALLVGEAGSGKETLVAHLAYGLTKDEVPPALFDLRLVGLEIGSLVAGAPPEVLQARIQNIAYEIMTAGNILLYIPDIHNLLKTSGAAFVSAADALLPIIMNNSFPVVGATYPREFRQMIEPRSDFLGAFDVIRVEEISEAEAEKLMVYESLILEQAKKIFITFGAVKTSVTLAKKYLRDKLLPSSAEELLKESLVLAERRGERILTPDTVISVLESRVNVPVHEAGAEEAEELLHLEETIHGRLIDQEEAVAAVSNALREYRSGLSRAGGPIASFLFVGPTGVGKTELAKILARVHFGSGEAIVRFDMTEYQDKQSFLRLIGSPDGSVSGALTTAVREKPYSLILLDEFEKAFPDVLDLFLQVLDDGRLTDNLGRTADFTNTIIIATSNAHSDIVSAALNAGQKMNEVAEYLKKKLVDVLKPELINRFSRVIVFKDLSPLDIKKVARLNLGDLAEAVGEKGLSLIFNESAVSQIAKKGYDPASGARPLRRVIDEQIKAPLAEKILKREFARGSRVEVSFGGEEFAFNEVSQAYEDKNQHQA